MSQGPWPSAPPLPRAKRKALQAWERQARRRGLAEATIAMRRRFFARFLRTQAGWALRWLTLSDLEGYLSEQADRVAATTQASYASLLRGFFRALVEEGLLSASPAEGLRVRRPAYPPQLTASEASVTRLLNTASRHSASRMALRDRALLELLYGLGLRSSEAAAIRIVDLDLERATLLVRRAKRGSQELLPLPPAVLPHLRAYLDAARPGLARTGQGQDAGHLLLGWFGRPLRAVVVRRIVRRVAERAGVRATPHALRRGVATHLVRAGVAVPVVQKLLGHQSLDTTAVYVRLDEHDLRQAVEGLERLRRAGSDGAA